MTEQPNDEHPSDEQLADLAADVLPPDFAAVVEAHLFECPRCSDLLAQAEGLGRLLHDAPDAVMPDQVWDRISVALAAAASAAPTVESAGPATATAWPGATTTGPTTTTARPPSDDDAWLTQTWPAVPAAGWTPQDPGPAATGHLPLDQGPVDPGSLDQGPVDPGLLEQARPEQGHEQAPREQPPYDDAPTAQWQVFVDEADDEVDARPRRLRAADAAAAETGPNAPSDHVPRRREGSRLGRPSMSVSRLRSRRDMREERRHASLERYLRPLGIAAGVVLAVGLGGFAVKGLAGAGGGSSSASALGAADSAGGAAEAAGGFGLITSGTNYTKATITTAALKAARSGPLPVAGGGSAAAGTFAAAAGSSAAVPANPGPVSGGDASASAPAAVPQSGAPKGTLPSTSPRDVVAGDGSDQRLRDPAALQACLKELQVPAGTTPILVDLAKFDGRDAAIIVVAGRDGGYEVWAVARDCRTGAGGQLSYTSVPAS